MNLLNIRGDRCCQTRQFVGILLQVLTISGRCDLRRRNVSLRGDRGLVGFPNALRDSSGFLRNAESGERKQTEDCNSFLHGEPPTVQLREFYCRNRCQHRIRAQGRPYGAICFLIRLANFSTRLSLSTVSLGSRPRLTASISWVRSCARLESSCTSW